MGNHCFFSGFVVTLQQILWQKFKWVSARYIQGYNKYKIPEEKILDPE